MSVILDDFRKELNNPETYYLVDSIANPGEVGALTIMVASPRKQNYSSFSKYPNLFRYYMPLWKNGELQSLWHYSKLSEIDFWRRFTLFSGVPRFIFEDQHEAELLRKLKIVNLDKVMVAFESFESDEDLSYYLIQMVPTDNYDNYHVSPLSTSIGEQITEKFIEQSKLKLLEFWENSKSKDFTNLSTFRGAIFENITHRILAQGHTFEIYGPLGDIKASWSQIKIPPCEVKITPQFVTSPDNTYYRPVNSNFPVIDSWIGNFGFFQITIASRHPLKAKWLADYVSISNEKKKMQK